MTLCIVGIAQTTTWESENVFRITDQATIMHRDRSGNSQHFRILSERCQQGLSPSLFRFTIIVDKHQD
jgi:hypothetical protein